MASTNYVRGAPEKTCTRCQQQKSREEFYKNPRYSDGLFAYCKGCQKDAQRSWRSQNKAHHDALIRQNGQLRRDRNTRVVLEHLLANPCVDCGASDPMVLQFDHVRGEKAFEVSASLASRSAGDLAAEMAKCDIRCANCHTKRTAIVRNTYKYQLLVSEHGYGN